MAKASWLKLRDEERAELESSFGTSGWRILSQGELPSFVPQTLRQKTVSALAITADSPTGGTYYVLSVQRVDKKDRALDIEPFGLILHSTGAAVEGVFIHHGDWRARTRPVPENLWRQLEEAGDFMWARLRMASSKVAWMSLRLQTRELIGRL